MTLVKTKKYSYIDSIRGYAVLMVLATHVFAFGGSNANPGVFLSKFLVQCRMGVMLFYMVSALTLFLSYEQKINAERYHLSNFFIRRFFRIVPLFYFVCLYRILFYKFDLMAIVGTITFTNGFMPPYIHGIVVGGWSIAVESIFYLILPLLYRHINTTGKSAIFFLLAFSFAIGMRFLSFRFLNAYYSPDILMNWTLVWLPMQMPVFAMGIFLYFLFFKSKIFVIEFKDFGVPFSYFLIFCAVYFFIIASYSMRLFMYENIALSFALMLFVAGMAIHPGNIFNNRIMQFFGKISYSFYLLHPIVIELVGPATLNKLGGYRNLTVGFFLSYILLLVLTCVSSYISYRLIEQKFQKLGTFIIARREKNGPMANGIIMPANN